ncbi:hypothetical protein [Rhodopila sp.]|jgi:hypothetical protein|uniref:hypothetical protein n=1 Tax=Rhodopila sp. TaxID=2480087 RepID=UPI002BF34919|nr:hypothetical protein [Rhodopila sp.]HVZ10510.1 hypothetical protein [Rhodopila sp.]
MLDLFGILFSSTIMMLVVFRAVQLDRVQAWFQVLTRPDPEKKQRQPQPWQRRG